MLFQDYLKLEIFEIVKKLLDQKKIEINDLKNKNFSVEVSQKKEFGDLSSNVALVFSKFFKTKPEILANEILLELKKNSQISKIEVVKPGFINIFFLNSFWQSQLSTFIKLQGVFDYKIPKKNICIEYVSANPTGLMHIGHARGAVFGDTLSSILEEVGHNVTREYYINDAGEQIKKLKSTVNYHINNLLDNKNEVTDLPDDLYPGEYILNVAKKLITELSIVRDFDLKQIRSLENKIISIIINDIKDDLKKVGVKHDKFTSEKKVSSKANVEKLKEKLIKSKLAYFGVQEKPKNIPEKDWKQEEQFLFCSKKFGDDSDRTLIKPNGEITYFMSDILYHQNKIERNYDELINVWGVDHFGYVKRLKSAINAINEDKKIELEIKLTSLVNLMKNNVKFKMSKRRGTYVTMREVIDKVGVDALRFMMNSRNADKTIDFDFQLLQQKNKENQVFYVQYAFARCMSILNSSKENFKKKRLDNFNLEFLDLHEEKMIIKYLCSFYNIIKGAAQNYEPHRITNFLYDLSKIFHYYWGLGNIDKNKRIISENFNITESRLALVKALSLTIKKGLSLLKINSPVSM